MKIYLLIWYILIYQSCVCFKSYRYIRIYHFIFISIFLRIYLQFRDFFHNNIVIYLGFDIFRYIISRYIAFFVRYHDISTDISIYPNIFCQICKIYCYLLLNYDLKLINALWKNSRFIKKKVKLSLGGEELNLFHFEKFLT